MLEKKPFMNELVLQSQLNIWILANLNIIQLKDLEQIFAGWWNIINNRKKKQNKEKSNNIIYFTK